MNSATKVCQNCKREFSIEPEDFSFYEKINVPPPTFCPFCRFARRFSYRNERNLFWNKSAKSGKKILSLYPLQSHVTVYDEDEWFRDDWDALEYGRDYDFSKPFFEQFHELARTVPRHARSNTSGNTANVASDYVANTGWSRNCYFIFNASGNENCAYGNGVDDCRECFDCSNSIKCELSYESFLNRNCYKTHFSSQCEECMNVWFSKDCIGCTDCFGCINLRNKKFYIFNIPYSKEEYREKLKNMELHKWSGLKVAREKTRDFWLKNPVKYMRGINNINSTGDYIDHSRNVHLGYIVRESENVRYCQYLSVPSIKDCMDVTLDGWGSNNELCYENSISGLGISNSRFSAECWPEVRDTEYSMFCKNVSNVFGCVGLKNKQYCVFNKQYSKNDYKELTGRIKKHMDDMPYTDKNGNIYRYGEFFPIEHSPFGYNISAISEHYPLSKEQALDRGYAWNEPESKEYDITMKSEDIPDSINDIADDILSGVIACVNCARAYRIIKMELDFLRAENIPLPRLCPDCRHKMRIAQRNPYFFYNGECGCAGGSSSNGKYKNSTPHFHREKVCPSKFITSYAPDRPEIVYCEQCYQAEVV
ncbi:MAG: hypothetical protein HY433_03325 [Candidatus Liptonbacteria bacterium]|nr:hypothetical protein [Candidatus Liptonbacteria bacterium]